MSLLDTIEPALEIDSGTLVTPEGVTNLEKFLRAHTGHHVPKSRRKLAARARAARDQIHATRPFTKVERVSNCCTKVVGFEDSER
jgi:hypothetical protein